MSSKSLESMSGHKVMAKNREHVENFYIFAHNFMACNQIDVFLDQMKLLMWGFKWHKTWWNSIRAKHAIGKIVCEFALKDRFITWQNAFATGPLKDPEKFVVKFLRQSHTFDWMWDHKKSKFLSGFFLDSRIPSLTPLPIIHCVFIEHHSFRRPNQSSSQSSPLNATTKPLSNFINCGTHSLNEWVVGDFLWVPVLWRPSTLQKIKNYSTNHFRLKLNSKKFFKFRHHSITHDKTVIWELGYRTQSCDVHLLYIKK